MNPKLLAITIIALLLPNLANSASIYKCTKKDKTVIFTDGKCPSNTETMLFHQETEQEINRRIQDKKNFTIKKLIAANQVNAAKEYAEKNNLSEVFHEQLGIYAQQKNEEEKQDAERDKQQQLAIQQRTLAVQQQQLELQKQQVAIEKEKAQAEQEKINNQIYYSYPSYVTPTFRNRCQYPYCVPFSRSTGTFSRYSIGAASQMNPQPYPPTQMNPPMAFPSQMNPPLYPPTQMTPLPFFSIQINPSRK